MNAKVKTNKTGLRLWDSAYNQYHQFIADTKKMVLYERFKKTETFEMSDMNVTIDVRAWSPWQKIAKPFRMDKAWHRRELSIEDLILGNDEKE